MLVDVTTVFSLERQASLQGKKFLLANLHLVINSTSFPGTCSSSYIYTLRTLAHMPGNMLKLSRRIWRYVLRISPAMQGS
jgi:hypothetical protein